MRERKRITKPLIYAIHMHSKILDNDSQYIRMASHIFLGGKGSIGYGLNVPPFKNAKFLQWKNLVMAFFWNLWKERNQRIFTEETQIYTKLYTMLFTKVYPSVNCLIFLLPIVMPPSLLILECLDIASLL